MKQEYKITFADGSTLVVFDWGMNWALARLSDKNDSRIITKIEIKPKETK
jgi:hypothetical protein